jgi:hypothetical protein
MKFTISVFFVLGLTLASLAQSPSKVLKQAEKALGGTKALQSIKSLSKSGHITRMSDDTTGSYVYQASQPNLLNVSFDLNGFETEMGYNGRSGWARTVVLTTPNGVTIKLYFDAASGLPIRDEISSGGISETCDYGDYRDVGATKQAFFNRVKLGDETYEIKLDDIKINPHIARSEFDFPNLSGKALPDIPALLRDLQGNEDKVDALLDTYSFVQKNIHRELGNDGVLRETESETHQMSFYKGYRIKRLIEKNGKPLNQNDQENADKDAGKQVEEIEKKIAKADERRAKGTNDNDEANGKRISVAELLRASKLSNPRRERFRGRDVVVFDFEPNPAFDMKNAKSMLKFFGKTAGVIWIDEKDKQVARLEAVLYENINIGGGVLAKLNKGATFTLDRERIGNEIWLPSQTDINLSVRVFMVKGIDVNQIVKSYDYHKFETEVKGAKVDETKKP